jgi:hypothetical protein
MHSGQWGRWCQTTRHVVGGWTLVLTGGLGAAGGGHAEPAEAWLAWWQSCLPAAVSACAAAREAQALATHQQVARRVGSQLQLRSDHTPSRWTVIANDPLTAYLGELDHSDLNLLLVQTPGRAPQFKLVSRGGSLPLTLDAPPAPSPDGLRLVVVAQPETDRAGSITLWQRVGARWAQKLRLEPGPDLGYQFEGWRQDGAAVRLSWQRVAASCAPVKGRSQLRDGPFGWDLYPEAPPPCR